MTVRLDLATASAQQFTDRAWELIADGHTPQQVVVRLMPATKPEAAHLARRLPMLDERPAADRGAALARLAARAGMRRFGLGYTPDGRLADVPPRFRPAADRDSRDFPGDGCTVTYTARYCSDRDHFSFVGLGRPPQPHPLSATGHWSHFALPDAVAALGGPEAYVAAYVAAGPDRDRLFREAFEGTEQEEVARKPRKVVGKYTAKVVEPPAESSGRENAPPGGQRSLFP